MSLRGDVEKLSGLALREAISLEVMGWERITPSFATAGRRWRDHNRTLEFEPGWYGEDLGATMEVVEHVGVRHFAVSKVDHQPLFAAVLDTVFVNGQDRADAIGRALLLRARTKAATE